MELLRRQARQSLLLPHKEKCAGSDGHFMFQPLAVETVGIFNMPAHQLLTDLDR